MTTGTMMFYAGVALLCITVLLAIIFYIKKPKYTPNSISYVGDSGRTTQKLKNAYPTDRMTNNRGSTKRGHVTQTVAEDAFHVAETTEIITGVSTELLQETSETGYQAAPTEMIERDN